MCFIFHNWGKWKQLSVINVYDEQIVSSITTRTEIKYKTKLSSKPTRRLKYYERKCNTCGKVQNKKLKVW